MLYQQTQPQVRMPEYDPRQQPVYQAFLRGLRDQGYFEAEAEGSARWIALEQKARDGWRTSKTSDEDDR